MDWRADVSVHPARGRAGSAALACGALASPANQAVALQGNATHDGHIADAGIATPLTQAWAVTLPSIVSYPLIVNGRVFVTTADKTLYALNQATGATLWSRAVGGSYFWSGIAYDRGQLFVVNGDGLLTAVDPASGSVNWSKQLPGQYSFSSEPTAIDGIVYVGGAGSGGTLYAVREHDGHVLWTRSVANGDHSSPAVSGDAVFVSYACHRSYAFHRVTGDLLWDYSTGCSGGGGRTPVVANGQRARARHVLVGDPLGGDGSGARPAQRAPRAGRQGRRRVRAVQRDAARDIADRSRREPLVLHRRRRAGQRAVRRG